MRKLLVVFIWTWGLAPNWTSPAVVAADATWPLWRDGRPLCQLVLPTTDQGAARLARTTLAHFLHDFYAMQLPEAADPAQPGTYLVLGRPENNPTLAKLVRVGLKLSPAEIGEEGFQLLTHEDGDSRYIIAYGRTARALKHACQELIFYRILAQPGSAVIETPLHATMKPMVAYRGVYMLPCWSAQDSLESWQRVLRFNSELTLNRNWFWLDGFPLAGHTGEYTNTALADSANVQGLINLSAAEEMKIYIGGGWFTWHHEKAVGKNYALGQQYYLDYLKAFTNFHGFYIEPTGEGEEIKNWRPECDSLRTLIRNVLRERPDFELGLAIGKFNNREYLDLMKDNDPGRVFWWWCWGDPIRDRVLEMYPTVLRWHLSKKMSEYHGSVDPPSRRDSPLAGVVTSYDPGQGFGNPWNGWGKLGVKQPRDFHPHTVPYFAQQYFYRERCWNLDLTEDEFVARLHRRLFDANAPAEAGRCYWQLSRMAQDSVRGQSPPPEQLPPIEKLLGELKQAPATPRMADTLARMGEALTELKRRARRSQ